MTDITADYHKDKMLLKPTPTKKSVVDTIEEDKCEREDFSSSLHGLSFSRSNTSIKIDSKKKFRQQVSRGISESSRRINITQLELKIEENDEESKAILIEQLPSSLKKSLSGSISLVDSDKSSLLKESSFNFNKRASTQYIRPRENKAKLEEDDESQLQHELEKDIKEGDEA